VKISTAILTILVMLSIGSTAYYEGYKQGRIDKNAEIMQAVTGDPGARIALMTKNKLTFHAQGICVTCHGG
jgi:hypothetical protein